MHESNIRGMIREVKEGGMSRRSFVQRLAAWGIGAPLASQMLAWNGVAMAQTVPEYAPTQAGGGGTLNILSWQAATALNPAFALGPKDFIACRIAYEPLAGWHTDGHLVPQLAAEIPTLENGGVAEDGLSVTWKLKQGVQWHDGAPFTADDVVFTWELLGDPAAAASILGKYQDIRVEKLDDYTVRLHFAETTPYWANAFVGAGGEILPKHHFEDYRGEALRNAPANLAPIGTGPYKIIEFRPGDVVLGERNENYHVANQPHFDRIEIKGGGDSTSAVTAVLQTAEFDFAPLISAEDAILTRLEAVGRGRVILDPSADVEQITCNVSDPYTEIDGERSHVSTRNPTLGDPEVRRAINLLIDRDTMMAHIYGRDGTATANYINRPVQFRSDRLTYEFSIEKAKEILDAAGWVVGADGVRAKDDTRLKLLFQTSVNPNRQRVQAIFQDACRQAGVEVELKSIAGTVFFSSDVGNPDTRNKFYADLQLWTQTSSGPDPYNLLRSCVSWEIPQKSNGWMGYNFSRHIDQEADELYTKAGTEMDPATRAEMLVRVNEIFCEGNIIMPIHASNRMSVAVNDLVCPTSAWDCETWSIASWYRA